MKLSELNLIEDKVSGKKVIHTSPIGTRYEYDIVSDDGEFILAIRKGSRGHDEWAGFHRIKGDYVQMFVDLGAGISKTEAQMKFHDYVDKERNEKDHDE